jgi:hypothetical protein
MPETYYQQLGGWKFKELPHKPGRKEMLLRDVFRYDIGRDTLVSVYRIFECEIIRDYILTGEVVILPLSVSPDYGPIKAPPRRNAANLFDPM